MLTIKILNKIPLNMFSLGQAANIKRTRIDGVVSVTKLKIN